ncbi:MAG: membrane dipeptidase [Thermoguttaceae bacterium]|jgi:membrane dipeptidase|nr:membrane dipeptidase [Thermoguttaceae bacterium]
MKLPAIDRRRFLGSSLGLAVAGTSAAAFGADAPPASDAPAPVGPWQENETIVRPREIALDILKPTPAQLEHGLQLHAASVVFDSYGFAPRAAVDGDAIAAAVEAGASPDEVQDMREDMSMTRWATDPVERAEFQQAFEASGVTCVFQNAGQEGQDPLRLLKRLARFTYATDLMRDYIPKAATPDEVVQAKQQGRRCLYFTGNGVPLRQQWDSVEDELSYVRIFFQLGIRMMHMTYQRRNMIGDGCGEPTDAGLSDFGRAVVKELNRQGVIVDVAHSGWRTGLEAAKASERPMVDSHTVCCGLHEHFRGKPDDVIRAIADTGGYIGICAIPAYLGGTCDIAALLDHVDHVVKHFGVDHVAIGTDVAYSSRNTAAENKKIPSRPRQREPFRSLWPEDAFKLPETAHPNCRASLAWTNWPLFTVGMIQRGYRDEDIQKILGGNVLRVARAVLEDRA